MLNAIEEIVEIIEMEMEHEAHRGSDDVSGMLAQGRFKLFAIEAFNLFSHN